MAKKVKKLQRQQSISLFNCSTFLTFNFTSTNERGA